MADMFPYWLMILNKKQAEVATQLDPWKQNARE